MMLSVCMALSTERRNFCFIPTAKIKGILKFNATLIGHVCAWTDASIPPHPHTQWRYQTADPQHLPIQAQAHRSLLLARPRLPTKSTHQGVSQQLLEDLHANQVQK